MKVAIERECTPRWPPLVDRGLARAGDGGYPLDREAGHALLKQQLPSSGEDIGANLSRWTTPAPRARAVG
jgi:hypothetical protein